MNVYTADQMFKKLNKVYSTEQKFTQLKKGTGNSAEQRFNQLNKSLHNWTNFYILNKR